jgi:hypothetical protein
MKITGADLCKAGADGHEVKDLSHSPLIQPHTIERMETEGRMARWAFELAVHIVGRHERRNNRGDKGQGKWRLMLLSDLTLLLLGGGDWFRCRTAGATNRAGGFTGLLRRARRATRLLLAARCRIGRLRRTAATSHAAVTGLPSPGGDNQPHASEGENSGSEGTIGKMHEI